MLFFHSILALYYIVLAIGAGLVIWSIRYRGAGSLFARIVGAIIFILALISIFSITFPSALCFLMGKKGELCEMSISKDSQNIEPLGTVDLHKTQENTH